MFTGLVQAIGEVQAVEPRGTGVRLRVRTGLGAQEPWVLGESVAVNGACLTVSEAWAEGFAADVLAETLRCTTFRGLKAGDGVNLERALRFGDRLGGHLVSGHVDEAGEVLAVRAAGEDCVVRVGCSGRFARGMVRKGSVTISGVSLTVTAVGGSWFEVALIPTTRRETTLGRLGRGTRVNLEADLIGAYVRRAMGQADDETLQEILAAGFAD